MATNPYSYGSLGQRWTVGEPTSKSLLDVSRVKADANRWALEQLIVDPDDTANFVLTAPGLNIDSNTLYVDSVNNSVGFRLTNPNDYAFNGTPSWVASGGAGNASVIVVSGTTSSGYLAFADGTTGTDRYSGNIQYNHSTNTMSFKTNGGVEAMTLDSSQRVGISTSSPSTLLQLNEDYGTAALSISDDSSAGDYLTFQIVGGQYNGGANEIQAINTTDLSLNVATARSLIFKTSNTERARITSAGTMQLGGQTGTLKLGNDGTYYGKVEWEYSNNELAYTIANVGTHTFNTNSKEVARFTQSNGSGGLTLKSNAGNDLISMGPEGSGGFEEKLLLKGYNSGTISFQIGHSVPNYINTGQNFGIGTSSPTGKLQVKAATNSNLRFYDSSGRFVVEAVNDAVADNIELVISAEQLDLSTNGASALYIDSSQRVGIGTTAPTQALDVAGQITINNGSGYLWSTGAVQMYSNGSYLRMRTGSIDRFEIDSNGDVAIGRTPYTNYKFTVQSADSSSSTYAIQIQNSSGYGLIQARSDGLISTGNYTSSPYNNTTGLAANMYVDSSGRLHRSTSSAKYKTGVETIEDSYADAILNMRPVWYRSLSVADNADHGFWGFIAEEVAEIDPRLVQYRTTESVISEESGREETVTLDEPIPEGVSYDRFVPLLLNLIQRQQQSIETLETKVAALEAA